jgi:hypothetical protein
MGGHIYSEGYYLANFDYDGNFTRVIENGSQVLASSGDGRYAYLNSIDTTNRLVINDNVGTVLGEIDGSSSMIFSSADFDAQRDLYLYGIFVGKANLNGTALESFDTTHITRDTTLYIPDPNQPGSLRRVDTTITHISILRGLGLVVAKFNPTGSQVWLKTIVKDRALSLNGSNLKIMNDQSVIIAGNFGDTITIGNDKLNSGTHRHDVRPVSTGDRCRLLVRRGMIQLYFPLLPATNRDYAVSIVNLKGQTIFKAALTRKALDSYCLIPIRQNIPKGFYVLSVRSGGKVLNLRFAYNGL